MASDVFQDTFSALLKKGWKQTLNDFQPFFTLLLLNVWWGLNFLPAVAFANDTSAALGVSKTAVLNASSFHLALSRHKFSF